MKRNEITMAVLIFSFFSAGFRDDYKKNSALAQYEVKLTFTGYTSLYSSDPLKDCDIRKNGTVVLSGSLSGTENVADDDDIVYTGILQIDIDMDICSAKRLPNGEDKFCYMTVTGHGPVNTEFTINYGSKDSARGAYIKISYDDTLGNFTRKVVGNCNPQDMVEEQNMVPNETIASIFNGYELPMLIDRTLRVGRYVATGELGETVVEVLRVVRQ